MFTFADSEYSFSEKDLVIVDFIAKGMENADKDLLEKKLTSAQIKKLTASDLCGEKDRTFPMHDCAHATAALQILGTYTGPSSKVSIKKCIAAKANALNVKINVNDAEDYSDLKDNMFVKVDVVDDVKVRMYPIDTKDHVIQSLNALTMDIMRDSEELKGIHTSISAKAKEFGINVHQWDPENEDSIKYDNIAMNAVSLEDILERPDVKEHIDNIKKEYVPKSEHDALKASVDGDLQTSLSELGKKISGLEVKNSELSSSVDTLKSETSEGAKERVELLDSIHKQKAEKIVILRMALGKDDAKDIQCKDDFQTKIDLLAQKDKSALDLVLVDLESDFISIKTPSSTIDPNTIAQNDSVTGVYTQKKKDTSGSSRVNHVQTVLRGRGKKS